MKTIRETFKFSLSMLLAACILVSLAGCNQCQTEMETGEEARERKIPVMMLTFSKDASGTWICDQSGSAVVSKAFIVFAWEKYSGFARRQTDPRVNLSFALSFPAEMPCAIHHFLLSTLFWMGPGVAYTKYETPDGVWYGYILQEWASDISFARADDYVSKAKTIISQHGKRSGMEMVLFRYDDFHWHKEVNRADGIVTVADYVSVLSRYSGDLGEKVYSLNVMLGQPVCESLSKTFWEQERFVEYKSQ